MQYGPDSLVKASLASILYMTLTVFAFIVIANEHRTKIRASADAAPGWRASSGLANHPKNFTLTPGTARRRLM